MTTTKRKVSVSLDEDLVSELEAGGEALSSQVNEAVRQELTRRRRYRLLGEMLDRLDATPRLDAVSCGPIDIAPAGGSSGSTLTLHCAGADAVVAEDDFSGLLPPHAVARVIRARHQANRMSVIRLKL